MKRYIWILIGIAVLLIVVFAVMAIGKAGPKFAHFPSSNFSEVGNGSRRPSTLPTCGQQTEFFTVSPLTDAASDSITPLGNVAPPDHTFPTPHTYISLANRRVAAAIQAPGDLTIIKVSSNQSESLPGQAFSIDFELCAEVSGYFNHINELSAELEQQIGQFTQCETHNPGSGNYINCWKDVTIPIKTGTLLGYAGGPSSDGSAALDLGLRDTRRKPINFINDKRNQGLSDKFTVCPYDYFKAGPAKTLVMQKLQADANISPICGSIDRDIAGTAQGRWFLPGKFVQNSEAGHLSLIPSNTNNADNIISVGNDQVGTGLYDFTTKREGQINRQVRDITPDNNTYCFQNLRNNTNPGAQVYPGYIFLKLLTPTALTIERSPSGTCPINPNQLTFSSRAVTFER